MDNTYRHSATLQILCFTGLELLLETVYRQLLQNESDSLRSWAVPFKNNDIGGSLKFFINEEGNLVEFYCPWKKEAIAIIKFYN